ncbi:kinetochore-associated protein NSL1 homolog [Sardina pilchardus]|uniref:kinetochore-associated protein NSL1 homolog n=1 Tax=Sardina pilchardus TaxID=27697 RepID=UPI002E13504A
MALKVVTTDQALDFQLGKYKGLFNSLLEGQNEIAENVSTDLMQELISTFETAVRENIIVDGSPSDEAQHEDGERITLDDILDEKIVETSRKRSCYPKKIIPFVVRSLKAERKLMEMYEHTADTEEMEREAFQDHIMKNVSEGVPRRFKQVTAVMKSLQEVCVRAEGLHQVLSLQPSAKSVEIYREVVGSHRDERS